MTFEIIGCGWNFPPKIDAQGGISLTNNQNEIEQSILIILGTTPGQRVMRPNFGCRLNELIFSPNNSHTAAQARRYVEEALGMWEPRINVKEIFIYSEQEDSNILKIKIEYQLKATHDERSLVYPFYIIPEEMG